jgi:hypothetical protein
VWAEQPSTELVASGSFMKATNPSPPHAFSGGPGVLNPAVGGTGFPLGACGNDDQCCVPPVIEKILSMSLFALIVPDFYSFLTPYRFSAKLAENKGLFSSRTLLFGAEEYFISLMKTRVIEGQGLWLMPQFSASSGIRGGILP